MLVVGLAHRRAGTILVRDELHHVHLIGVDRDRHLVGRGIQLGKHVPRIVREPLCGLALVLRSEADRPADLKDHLGHGRAKPIEHLVEHLETLRALAVRLADVDVKNRRACIVAVDCLLDLVLHRDGDVVGSRGKKLGA